MGETARLERLARYATRVALAVGAVRERGDGRIEVDTPPDPTTGATVTVLDRLDFAHAVCQQVPDRGLHQRRPRERCAPRSSGASISEVERRYDPPDGVRPSPQPVVNPLAATSPTGPTHPLPAANAVELPVRRIDRTQPMVFSADETADVGVDLGIPVVEAIGAGTRSRFNGRIPEVTISVH